MLGHDAESRVRDENLHWVTCECGFPAAGFTPEDAMVTLMDHIGRAFDAMEHEGDEIPVEVNIWFNHASRATLDAYGASIDARKAKL